MRISKRTLQKLYRRTVNSYDKELFEEDLEYGRTLRSILKVNTSKELVDFYIAISWVRASFLYLIGTSNVSVKERTAILNEALDRRGSEWST